MFRSPSACPSAAPFSFFHSYPPQPLQPTAVALELRANPFILLPAQWCCFDAACQLMMMRSPHSAQPPHPILAPAFCQLRRLPANPHPFKLQPPELSFPSHTLTASHICRPYCLFPEKLRCRYIWGGGASQVTSRSLCPIPYPSLYLCSPHTPPGLTVSSR